MRLTYRQSGGFAGTEFRCELDTANLQEAEALALASFVDQARIEQIGKPNPLAHDAVRYEITIEDDGHVTEVTFDDWTLPQSLLPLITYLQRRSKIEPS